MSESETIGYVWTGEFDLNTLLVDGKFLEFGKEKLEVADSKRYVRTGPKKQFNACKIQGR